MPKPARIEAPSDEALIVAIGDGDRVALSELYDRFHRDVYRFLGRFVGRNARDVDDLVQQTFIEVTRAAARFRSDSQVKTWMFGIAANVARHWLRDEVRRRKLLGAAAEVAAVEATSHASTQHERSAQLQRAIAALPHDLRVTFVMCAIEEVSGADAAVALGVPVGTVWRRLHEARNVITTALRGGKS